MQVKKADLLPVLDIVKPAVLKNDSIQILTNVCFSNGMATAYNNLVGITTLLPEVMEDVSICLPFDKLYIFVNGANDTIDISFEETTVKLKSGRYESVLPFENTKDFPSFSKLVEDFYSEYEMIEVDKTFISAIRSCLPFAAKSSSKIQLSGVMHDGKAFWSADGSRISYFKFKTGIDKPFILPSDFSKLLSGLKSVDSEMGGYYIAFDPEKDCLMIGYDQTIIFGSVIDGSTYPKVAQYFPTPADEDLITLPKDDLKTALKTVGDFTGDVIEEASCSISFGDAGISLNYESKMASISNFLNFGDELPTGEFVINPYHFNIMLDNCDKFFFSTEGRSFFGKSSDKKFKAVIAIKEAKAKKKAKRA